MLLNAEVVIEQTIAYPGNIFNCISSIAERRTLRVGTPSQESSQAFRANDKRVYSFVHIDIALVMLSV